MRYKRAYHNKLHRAVFRYPFQQTRCTIHISLLQSPGNSLLIREFSIGGLMSGVCLDGVDSG